MLIEVSWTAAATAAFGWIAGVLSQYHWDRRRLAEQKTRGERWALLRAIDFHTSDEEAEKRGFKDGTPEEIVQTARLFADYLDGSHVKSAAQPREAAH